MKHTLNSLPFSNSFSNLPEDFYARVEPSPTLNAVELIHFNPAAAELLELTPDCHQTAEFTAIVSGNQSINNAAHLAMRYAGHQFGQFVPSLGDGRAIMLGETTNSQGQRWEIQLKGSGMTPFSRMGDGRAVLRSSIREYLCSEAMFGLGIPTTRALCITGCDDKVYREQVESSAILTRLAPSHVRFGSLEYFYYRNKFELLKQLLDYVIQHHYPELSTASNPYLALLHAVIERTAKLIAQWQAVGFCHGVMNTDNMSILGLTLDYGPFGFLDDYRPHHICNLSDHSGRYAYDQQPEIGLWNLACLAQTLTPFISEDDAKQALGQYWQTFTTEYQQRMANKLGFESHKHDLEPLIKSLLIQMQHSQTDYTHLFRQLCDVERGSDQTDLALRDIFSESAAFDQWLKDYRQALRQYAQPDSQRQTAMKQANPKYVLRNHMAQRAIEMAEQKKDYSEIDRLMCLLQRPFDEHEGMEHYASPASDSVQQIGVSCSS